MLKTLIAIAAICSLVAVLAVILFAPGDNMDLKVALATTIVGAILAIAGFAYGVQAGKEVKKP